MVVFYRDSKIRSPVYDVLLHSALHYTADPSRTSRWHVDAYKGVPWSSGRTHELHTLMVCYYPQAREV